MVLSVNFMLNVVAQEVLVCWLLNLLWLHLQLWKMKRLYKKQLRLF